MTTQLSKRIILVVVVLAILVVGGVWLWKQESDRDLNQLGAVGQLGNNNAALVAPTTEKVALTVEDQFPGTVVFVSSVELPKGGWVVIHRDNAGAPGEIAGAGYFGADVLTGEVNLSKMSAEGEKYYAVLYHDNGDFNFDLKTDLVYRDANNQPVLATFTVTRTLLEHKG
ncbi:MAG: hypothetical protein AAB364_00110 [Patescibacteria group bacterium]